jgi:hypothetical protein
MNKYHQPRRCATVLHRSKSAKYDFRGHISLEDDLPCSVGISIGAGQRSLILDLRPSWLTKTAVFGDSTSSQPAHALLRRPSHDLQSDFIGCLLFAGRRYQIGVTILTGRDGSQALSLFVRPLHLYKDPPATSYLEVVR